jgi:hypothetical protein
MYTCALAVYHVHMLYTCFVNTRGTDRILVPALVVGVAQPFGYTGLAEQSMLSRKKYDAHSSSHPDLVDVCANISVYMTWSIQVPNAGVSGITTASLCHHQYL